MDTTPTAIERCIAEWETAHSALNPLKEAYQLATLDPWMSGSGDADRERHLRARFERATTDADLGFVVLEYGDLWRLFKALPGYEILADHIARALVELKAYENSLRIRKSMRAHKRHSTYSLER